MRNGLKKATLILVTSFVAGLVAIGASFAWSPQDRPAGGFTRRLQVRPVREVVVVDSKGRAAAAGGDNPVGCEDTAATKGEEGGPDSADCQKAKPRSRLAVSP